MSICEACGKVIVGEVAQFEAPAIDEYEKKVRIDEVISLLPLMEDDENDDVIGALCGDCCKSLNEILRERISEEEDLKKTYEECLKKEEEEASANEAMGGRGEKPEKEREISIEHNVDSEEEEEEEEEEGLCADQSKSPMPDREQGKGQWEGVTSEEKDREDYDSLKKEYKEKKKELEKIQEEKRKMIRANNEKMKEWNNALNNFLMDVSEQSDADEMMLIEKDYTTNKLKELEGLRVFNVDTEKGTINGYRISCAEDPTEFSAALGLCSHMLYNIYKEKLRLKEIKVKESQYSISPEGFQSVIRDMHNERNINLYVTKRLAFRQEAQSQEQQKKQHTEAKTSFLSPFTNFFSGKSSGREPSDSEPKQQEVPGVTLNNDQIDFEKGITILNERYFRRYCGKELNLKPSELTREKWEENMKQFLITINDEWERLFKPSKA